MYLTAPIQGVLLRAKACPAETLSTLSALHTERQDFKAIVSIFGQESALVYQIEQYCNKKIAEIEVLRGVLISFKDKEFLLCAEALHCQKKQLH